MTLYRLILKPEPTPFGKVRHLFPDGIPIKKPYLMASGGDKKIPCYEVDPDRLTIRQAEELGNVLYEKWAREMTYEQAVAEIKRGMLIGSIWMETLEEDRSPNILPSWIRPHPEDRAFPGNEPVGDNLCSRCSEPISDHETPIWFWSSDGARAWRYHGQCLGMQGFDDVDYSDDGVSEEQWKGGSFAAALESWNDDWEDNEDDWDDDEVVPTADRVEPLAIYGDCCACGEETSTTRNFIFMKRLAPIKGTGWGCVGCGLSTDGAIAVVCDRCLETQQPLVVAVCGHPEEKKRIPYYQLEPGVFDHDMSKHSQPVHQEVESQGLPTEDEFRAAFKALAEDEQPVIMTMLNWQGWCLLAAIQLVSTHPDAKNSPTIQVAVKVGRQIEGLIVGDSPRFALTARAGWNREESSIPLEELTAVLEERGKENIDLTISKEEAWSLISAIQLASRHPEYFGSPHMPIVHGVVSELQDAIAEEGSVLARIADAGWDASYDQPA